MQMTASAKMNSDCPDVGLDLLMKEALTELMAASLTTSLDQEKSVPVVKDEDWRQMVSRGRILPSICKRKKERNDTHSEKGRDLGDRVVNIFLTHHQGLGADLQSPLPKFLQALRMHEDVLQKLLNGVCVLFRAHIDVHGQVLAF